MTFLTLSTMELNRYDIMQSVIRKEMNATEAAQLLELSTRHIRRLKAKVIGHGAAGLIHGNRDRPGNRRIAECEREKIVKLLHKHYFDFGPTFTAEKLSECHNIAHDPKTLRSIMIKEALWKPRKAKAGSKHRSWRQRKAHYGEMIQFDGSYHDWFETGGEKVCVLLAVDDATGAIVDGEFAAHEGVKIQFERAMSELGIETISAHSPQAKGRVERAFETLQDRLIKELRLAGIKDSENGNRFLKEVFI